MNGFFVTGTDTDVGKTLVSSWLLTQLDASYWKPVQAGVMPETDSSVVRRLAEIDPDRILPEAYVLPEAIAPHEAARRAGIAIDMAKFVPPVSDRLLVVEGAGGLMVPLTDTAYVIDLAAELHLPVILVARFDARHHQPYAAVARSDPPARAAPRRRCDQWTRDAA